MIRLVMFLAGESTQVGCVSVPTNRPLLQWVLRFLIPLATSIRFAFVEKAALALAELTDRQFAGSIKTSRC